MPDENTSDSPSEKSPDLPDGSVEAAPAAVLVSTKKVSEDNRSEPRAHVRWHVDAIIDGPGVYHGFVKSISMQGMDVFLERNLQNVKLIKLRIHVPPLHKTNNPHAVVVSGKILYSAYDSKESFFRSGVSFLKFDLESDRAYLQSCLASHINMSG